MTDTKRFRLATSSYSGSAAASLGLFKTRVAALLALAAVFLASAAAKRSRPARLAERAGDLPKKSHQRLPLQSDMTVAYINFGSGQQHDSLQYDAAH